MTEFKVGLAVAGSLISGFVGGFDTAFITLLTFIVIDYISGVAKAINGKELSSYRGLAGIVKKIALLLLVVVAQSVDNILGGEAFIRGFVVYFLIANEGISILENLAQLGVPIPTKLRDTLNVMKEKAEEKTKDIGGGGN